MPDTTTCGNCGEPLTEPASILAEQRLPCPKCGLTSRGLPAAGTDSLIFSDSVTFTLVPYPKALLTIARTLIDKGLFNIAIVTSHMACEVAAERAFDAAYAGKNLVALGEAVDAYMNGNNLANDRHRKLYNALTGTQLENEPFWSNFQAASEKRNAIIHKGAQATETEAKTAIQAATHLIAHLKQM